MARLLILAVLGVLLWLGVERAFEKVRATFRPPERSAPGARPAAVTEVLVRCSRCGVHVPRSRTLPGAPGEPDRFCSQECRTAALDEGS